MNAEQIAIVVASAPAWQHAAAVAAAIASLAAAIVGLGHALAPRRTKTKR